MPRPRAFKFLQLTSCLLFVPVCAFIAGLPDIEKIRLLYKVKEDPKPGEWLSTHDEKYYDLNAYQLTEPSRPDSLRKNIYIYGLGDNSRKEDSLVNITRAYLEIFFHLKTQSGCTFPLSCVPETMKRGEGAAVQVQTHFILDTLVNKPLPGDAAAAICFTKYDLYPGDDWNFVFGQTYTHDRVSVSSFHRYGDPSDPAEFHTVLKRTLKVASHETGHMFSIKHCVRFNCAMNGSNSLDESDEKPMHYCPDCLEKLSWNIGFDLLPHFIELKKFYERYGFEEEAAFISKNISCLNR